jgi:hypothetical protein
MKRVHRASLATLALDFAKGAFNIPVLGGVVALFIKKDEVSTADVLALIATGIFIIAFLIIAYFLLKPKEQDNDSSNNINPNNLQL